MTTEDEFGVERANLYQQIGEQKTMVDAMAIRRVDVNETAMRIAKKIDDIFAQAHDSRPARTSCVQVVIRDAMRLMLEGKTLWNEKPYTAAKE